mmetsp:Transcript_28472/g.32678  ORF Transcript_28472/g.32678 Transcript_28472/m.32678 type:complete len:183 (-) Transcript_28472:3018-3566(-)
MSMKKLKHFLIQSSELDELSNLGEAKKSNADKRKANGLITKKSKASSSTSSKQRLVLGDTNADDNDDSTSSKLQSQVASILFFDHAFSHRSYNTERSMKRKMNDDLKISEQRKKVKSEEGLGNSLSNSRSSSSSYQSKSSRHIPTYNKKKDEERKRVKSLQDLARKLQKRSTEKKNKRKNGI